MRLALNLGLDLPKREALPTRDVGGMVGSQFCQAYPNMGWFLVQNCEYLLVRFLDFDGAGFYRIFNVFPVAPVSIAQASPIESPWRRRHFCHWSLRPWSSTLWQIRRWNGADFVAKRCLVVEFFFHFSFSISFCDFLLMSSKWLVTPLIALVFNAT